jgi:hypothetical protein
MADLSFDDLVPKQQGDPASQPPAPLSFDDLVPAPRQAYTGQILPISVDAQGHNHFDSDAGILGSLKRSFMLPGDVMAGNVDPTSQEGIGRALEFATTVSPVNPAVRSGEAVIPGIKGALKAGRVETPTADELRAAASSGYDQVRDMGVDYNAHSVQGLAQTIQTNLEQDGILPELAPKSFSVLQKLQSAPEGSIAPLSGLEAARRAFGNAGKDFTNPTDQLAAQRAREGLDGFILSADPATVAAGPAQDAAKVLADARGNYAAASRSDQLTGVQEAAELRAAAANSGQNTGNAIRQRIASLLLKPKDAAGYTDEEIGLLNNVARGSTSANATRFVGNLLGGGGGLGAAVTGGGGALAGAMAGSPLLTAAGAALPTVGVAAKAISRVLTERALEQADLATRGRSPLAQSAKASAPRVPAAPEKSAALIRALLIAQQDKLRPDQ